MRFAVPTTLLFGLALASAAPTAQDTKVGLLIYGDVSLPLTPGCQKVPQNKEDGLPEPSNYFTKLQVNGGWICNLYRDYECAEKPFRITKGPGSSAEYESSGLFSASCSKN
ncbi:hypothetical protein N0V90_006719 [Kalmusia sp. IMI 367209]|nr:hypothetical protein N0V90_006719 [Kalmusia sp. IMI 367209]